MHEDFPKNELEFDRRFHHEQACLDYLFQLRWPEGFICPNCGHTAYWKSCRGSAGSGLQVVKTPIAFG